MKASGGKPGRTGARRDGAVLLSGYITQVYGAVVSLAFAPFILRAVGAEAYGLVGVFMIVQAWFHLLDAGMTPALTRQAARFGGGAIDQRSLARNVRGMEVIVGVTAVPLIGLALVGSGWLADAWLTTGALTVSEVSRAFQLIALILFIRWFSGVRRGLLAGFERHGSLHAVTFVVATLRYPGIVLWFSVAEPSATAYFAYQLVISVCEALVLWSLSRSLLVRVSGHPGQAVASLRDIAGFALTHGGLAFVWVGIVQTDKLLLSRYLPLAEFGYFTLAAAAAAGINLVVLPLGQMLKPRLAKLHAREERDALRTTYRRATRVAMVSLSGVTGLFLFFGEPILLLWTGDAAVGSIGGPVIGLYALGNLAMAMGSFCYYLQYADGRLGLHTIGSIGKLIVIVPAMYVAVTSFGLYGAAVAWALFWIVHLLTWVTWTHRVFLPGLGWRWLFSDVLRIVLPVLLLAWLTARWVSLPEHRLWALASLLSLLLGYSLLALLLSGLVAGRRGRVTAVPGQ